ncbi:hypothetical protein MJM45_29485, partial [Salmonella enterica subsp. enterica serovar Kentucky]|nr:hypothetical protein [Salmonella enterica subsp. enterica serovar Kentucky]
DILSNATSRAIGVLLPSLTNQVFAEVLRGIEAVTDAHGYQTMHIMRGEGDAEAAKLFADAFSQDPDFYAFIRSLRAYEKSFEGNQ